MRRSKRRGSVLALAATALSVSALAATAGADEAPPFPEDARDYGLALRLTGPAVPASTPQVDQPMLALTPTAAENRVCFRLDDDRLEQITNVEIRASAAGGGDALVLSLFSDEQGVSGSSLDAEHPAYDGCAQNAKRKVRRNLKRHRRIDARELYVEIDTREFPGGAVRGDLDRYGRQMCEWLCPALAAGRR